MSFVFRVDLESSKGISEGLPRLLDLLKEYDFKASFYLTMGGESNLFEILKYRGGNKGFSERKIKVFSFFEKLRMVLFPRDFVKNNSSILKRIIEEGHELGIHGWKHRRWTRGLEKINIAKDLDLAIEKYTSLFGKKPTSFASPAFRINEQVLSELKKRNINIISHSSSDIKVPKGMINIPVTIKGRNNSPIIESMTEENYSDVEILGYIKSEIKKNKISVVYVHGLYECIQRLDLIKNILEHLKNSKTPVKTIEEIANENPTNN